MFASFQQAGFECSSHKLRSGLRLDLIASTQHDQFVRDDYRRLIQLGIRTVRDGLRWHLVENPGKPLDFSSAIPLIEAANEAGIEVIWDLLHFGWPDHLDIFTPEWQQSFEIFAGEFARLWRRYSGEKPLFVVPVNEISFFSWAGGEVGSLNPFARNRGAELKRQLVGGFLAAAKAIRSEIAKVTIVAPEPVIHIVGDPADPSDIAQAEMFRLSMFEAWDMLCGRLEPQLGGHRGAFDVIGINYYDRNQWRNYGSTLCRFDAGYRPFHQILLEVWQRYLTPLLISETGSEGGARPQWFAYVALEARKAMRQGVNLNGICLYPILNHRGWDDDRLCLNGLFGEVAADGHRAVYAPLAAEMRKQEKIQRKVTGEVMTKQAADIESIDLVCYSHLRWNFVFQRPQHLMSRFARNRRVFFVEEPVFSDKEHAGIRVVVCPQSGVIVVTPEVPQTEAHDSAATVRGLLTAFLRQENVRRFVGWYYTPLALDYSPISPAELVVYDCMDELSLFRGASPRIVSAEQELLAVADMVFTGGTSLFEAKRERHAHVYAFPSGVDIAHFIQARTIALTLKETDPASDIIPNPTLGYAGVIDERLDLELIQELADRRPDWQIVMIGPVVKIDFSTLPQRTNIQWLGMKDYKDLPRYFAGWKVGLLPFALNDSTRFISPTKTPEYLAAGLRVVSTPIRDVVTPYGDLGMAEIGRNPDEFIAACDECIGSTIDPELQIDIDAFLTTQSWEDTWAAMNELIVRQMPRRTSEESELQTKDFTSNVSAGLHV